MIFVTVGTHEQQFNRLVKKVDELKGAGKIKDDVFIQTGFSDYEPKHCEWSKMLPYEEMDKMNRTADIVITHGGPASFIAVLKYGKIPIVVPRSSDFGEHVNNHQRDFCRKVAETKKCIILSENTSDLENIIKNYEKVVKKIDVKILFNNTDFCDTLSSKIAQLF